MGGNLLLLLLAELNSVQQKSTMENLSIVIFYTIFLCTRFSQGEEMGKLKFAPMRVVDVKNGVANSYFTAVKNASFPTGWAIQVKNNFDRYKIDGVLLAYMFDNSPKTDNATGQYHRFFGTLLCDLLIPDSRYDRYPQRNNLPREVMNLIFPGQQGSCNFTEGTKPILPSKKVNVAEYNNPMVRFPNMDYYQVYVNILSQSIRSDLENNYFFQVKLVIGNPPISARICLDTQWNYYIVWGICTVADFFESLVAGIGWEILQIF